MLATADSIWNEIDMVLFIATYYKTESPGVIYEEGFINLLKFFYII